MKREELIIGQIYRANVQGYTYYYIFKYSGDIDNNRGLSPYYGQYHKYHTFDVPCYEIYPASTEERQWLEACIKADKFIPKEEALKDVAPEYEYFKLDKFNWPNYIKNNGGKAIVKATDTHGDKTMLQCFKERYSLTPSTKEAYDRQNAPTESLLEEAKRRYPKGTKFKNLCDTISVSNGECKNCDYVNGNIMVYDIYNSPHTIYQNGKWAEIVSEEVTVDNLVKGEVYYAECTATWVFQFKEYYKDSIMGKWVSVKPLQNITQSGGLPKDFFKSIRKATPEERALLYPQQKEEMKAHERVALPDLKVNKDVKDGWLSDLEKTIERAKMSFNSGVWQIYNPLTPKDCYQPDHHQKPILVTKKKSKFKLI